MDAVWDAEWSGSDLVWSSAPASGESMSSVIWDAEWLGSDVVWAESAAVGGYEWKKKKPSRVIKDDREEKAAEFEKLLRVVTGQAVEKAAAAIKERRTDTKPPRMPDVRGVEPAKLRQWMPDLLSAYRTEYARAVADAIAAKRKREQDDEEDLLILTLLL